MVGEKLKSHTASLRAMPNDLGEDLKNLIEGSPQSCWTYAILWRCSSPQSVLTFHDGYCTATESKPKELRILGSSVTVTEDVTDAEWFFRISAAQSFGINEDLPGHAFCGSGPVWVTAEDSDARRWERATWGYQFGIRTVLCIPLKEKGVLELASTEIVPYELKMMEEMVNFIYAIGTPRPPIVPFFLNQFRNDKKLHERVVNEMQNRWSDNLSKKSQGKEKISDSKCSWPLLSESSDRTFSHSHDYSGPS